MIVLDADIVPHVGAGARFGELVGIVGFVVTQPCVALVDIWILDKQITAEYAIAVGAFEDMVVGR